MKIAHLADIQIRFGSRHPEYRQVFKKLYADLNIVKPDRIYLAGDLVHQKINMSPNSHTLLAELLINLSNIAPTDVILGNHDMNLQDKAQGDAISPIFDLASMLGQKEMANVIGEHNKNRVDFSKKAVYFFPDSGIYDITDKLTYGVYSCKDNQLFALESKKPGRYYAALFHGTIYGSRNDNGYLSTGDNLIKPSTFANYDIAMLGDIHEHQTIPRFKDDISDTIAYAGSLIQQNYGESIDKGYLLWDTDTSTFEKKIILNDYGFAKIHISRGENIEERIEHMRFSNDRRKTKVKVTWEDFEENYSLEKEIQIKKLVKEKHGCEVVNVNFEGIKKEYEDLESDEKEEEKAFLTYFDEFIDNNEFDDCDDDLKKEIIKFAEEVDNVLEIDESIKKGSSWELKSVEISNLFSFPKTPTRFDFDQELQGIVGVFGNNYNGKSNFVKALVWGLMDVILGTTNKQANKFLVNLYTDSEVGYAKYFLLIDDEEYYIERKVTRKTKSDGTKSNTYKVIYKKLIVTKDDYGNIEEEKWVSKISDKNTTEQKEVKDLVLQSIGTFEDFAKTSLQAQDGDANYLSLHQQPKNDLINKFLGLESYRDRHAYGKEFFNKIKNKQRELGDVIEIEDKIKVFENDIKEKEKNLVSLQKEKDINSTKKSDTDNRVLEYTQKLEKVEVLLYEDRKELKAALFNKEQELLDFQKEHIEVQTWLGSNFKKALPFKEGETLQKIQLEIKGKEDSLQVEKNNFLIIKKWIDTNPKKEEIYLGGTADQIKTLTSELVSLRAELKMYAGEDCPTCKRAIEGSEPQPEKHAECEKIILEKLKEIENKEAFIKSANDIVTHNTTFDSKKIQYNTLYSLCKSKRQTIDGLIEKEKQIKNSENLIEHNILVDNKTTRFQLLTTSIETIKGEIYKLKENDAKIDDSLRKKAHNITVQEEIDRLQSKAKEFQLNVFNLDRNIVDLSGDIKVLKNNKENYSDKLENIKREEKMYKVYSIYLQAVHRDGIPALIIRKKLPIINSKINSILQDIVDFKVELKILTNGDINEVFYFAEDKSDALPISGFASGAQKFVSIIAIKEALHYMSTLPKPSLSIIDEGFGSLDEELTMEMLGILLFLKSIHKNVIVITHRNEIKDFADKIIEAKKVKDDIPKNILDNNPNAGISIFSVK